MASHGILDLPLHLLQYAATHFTPGSFIVLRFVCRRFRDLSTTPKRKTGQVMTSLVKESMSPAYVDWILNTLVPSSSYQVVATLWGHHRGLFPSSYPFYERVATESCLWLSASAYPLAKIRDLSPNMLLPGLKIMAIAATRGENTAALEWLFSVVGIQSTKQETDDILHKMVATAIDHGLHIALSFISAKLTLVTERHVILCAEIVSKATYEFLLELYRLHSHGSKVLMEERAAEVLRSAIGGGNLELANHLWDTETVTVLEDRLWLTVGISCRAKTPVMLEWLKARACPMPEHAQDVLCSMFNNIGMTAAKLTWFLANGWSFNPDYNLADAAQSHIHMLRILSETDLPIDYQDMLESIPRFSKDWTEFEKMIPIIICKGAVMNDKALKAWVFFMNRKPYYVSDSLKLMVRGYYVGTLTKEAVAQMIPVPPRTFVLNGSFSSYSASTSTPMSLWTCCA